MPMPLRVTGLESWLVLKPIEKHVARDSVTVSRFFNDLHLRRYGQRRAVEDLNKEGQLQSRNDEIEPSRHVILSSVRGVVTELERLPSDEYIIRYHKSSADADIILDAGPWTGFRYRDAHWSFVKQ